MKHKSFAGPTIPFLTITLLLIAHACSIEDRPEIKTPESNTHNVTVEEALANLNSALELINGGGTKATIGGEVSSIKLITTADFPQTKALDGQDEFEQLLYVVDFEDNQGFAVLGADDRFVPVLAITEQGSSPANIVDPPSADPGSTSPEGLTLEQLYCEADGDYYLGNSTEFADMVGTLINDYLTITMTKIIDPPGDDDGSGPKPGDDNPTNPGHNNPESGFLHIYAMLNTCWHQKSPFNNSVTVKTRDGRICPIGCTTIAALQILTRNKDVSLPEYFGITSSSWNRFEECRFGNSTNSQLTSDLAKLGKSAADGIGVKYNFLLSDGTFATPASVTKYLKSIGYTNAKNNIGYSLSKIKDMLTSYKPVFIGVLASNLNGHAWVIDGIHEKLVTKDGASKKTAFLHCNWGWSYEEENEEYLYGVCNGYFESEVFDTTNNPEMYDSKDTEVRINGGMNNWWWYRIITY